MPLPTETQVILMNSGFQALGVVRAVELRPLVDAGMVLASSRDVYEGATFVTCMFNKHPCHLLGDDPNRLFVLRFGMELA